LTNPLEGVAGERVGTMIGGGFGLLGMGEVCGAGVVVVVVLWGSEGTAESPLTCCLALSAACICVPEGHESAEVTSSTPPAEGTHLVIPIIKQQARLLLVRRHDLHRFDPSISKQLLSVSRIGDWFLLGHIQ